MTDNNPTQLLKIADVAKLIGRSRSSLDRIRNQDPTFPTPIKDGQSRQAPCYFVRSEVEAWVRTKMDARRSA